MHSGRGGFGSWRHAPLTIDAMKEPEGEALVWFGVRALSVYEVLGPPIQEFLDDYTSDGFCEGWQGVESSIYLVAATDSERAMEVVDDEFNTPDSVKVFGQTIRHRALKFDVVKPFVHGLPVPTAEDCHEIFCELWSIGADRDPLEFFEGRLPPPENAYGMIAPIALYEHRARYEELRGPLP